MQQSPLSHAPKHAQVAQAHFLENKPQFTLRTIMARSRVHVALTKHLENVIQIHTCTFEVSTNL